MSDQISKILNVGITNGNLGSDPTLKNYESPQYDKSKPRSEDESEESFIEKKVKKNKSFMEASPSEAIENDILLSQNNFKILKIKMIELKPF